MFREKTIRGQDLFLALAMLAGEMTGIVLCIMTMLLKKSLLPAWLETVYMLLGGILWLGLMPVYFCLRAPEKEKGRQKVRRHWLGVLQWELWLLAAFFVWRLADRIWLAVWRSFFQSEALYGAVFFLLIFAAVFAASLLIHKILGLCGMARRASGAPGVLLTSCVLYASLVVFLAVSVLLDRLAQIVGASVVGMLAVHVSMACTAYGLVKLFLWAVCGKDIQGSAQEAAGWTDRRDDGADLTAMSPEEDIGQEAAGWTDGRGEGAGQNLTAMSPAEEMALQEAADRTSRGKGGPGQPSAGRAGNGSVRKILGTGIPLAVTAVLFALTNKELLFSSVTEQAVSAVEECLDRGYASLADGELAEAGRHFALAEARAKALQSLTDEVTDSGALETVYGENTDDTFIGTLCLSNRENMAGLEKSVESYLQGRDWYPALLRYYRECEEEEKELSLRQESLREEMLLACIADGQYSEGGVLFARDLEEHKLAVQKRLQDYEEEIALGGLFGLMERYGAEGGYTEDMAYQALDVAEKHPYSLLLQYMACQIAGSYQTDDAGHYGRTIEAARRFDRLYDDGSRTDEELARAKRFLGNVAAHCYDYETALLYLREVWELSGDTAAALSCARLYERRGEYGQCLEMAGDVLGEEPENTQALYLTAISSLKTRDPDGALDAAGRLGDLVADQSRPLDAAEDNNLYICAQYMAMEDSARWTDYTWQIYSSLTEDQAALARSHELLWHYMTGIHQCFMREDYEAAEEAVRKALALREDLPMGWYLMGTVALNRGEFETAQSYFEKALECGGRSPAIYFSLANAFDAMEDYENAWLYSKKVEEMLPYQDHGNDVYGISIHNKNLLGALSSRIGK